MLLKWEKEGEISVFKERCDGLGSVTGVDGDGHTLRYSKQKFSFAQFLARVCDDAHSGFVMKKVMAYAARAVGPLLKREKWRTPCYF